MGAWGVAKGVMTFMADVATVLEFVGTVWAVLLASGDEYARLRKERNGRMRALRLAFKASFKKKRKGKGDGDGDGDGEGEGEGQGVVQGVVQGVGQGVSVWRRVWESEEMREWQGVWGRDGEWV